MTSLTGAGANAAVSTCFRDDLSRWGLDLPHVIRPRLS